MPCLTGSSRTTKKQKTKKQENKKQKTKREGAQDRAPGAHLAEVQADREGSLLHGEEAGQCCQPAQRPGQAILWGSTGSQWGEDAGRLAGSQSRLGPQTCRRAGSSQAGRLFCLLGSLLDPPQQGLVSQAAQNSKPGCSDCQMILRISRHLDWKMHTLRLWSPS